MLIQLMFLCLISLCKPSTDASEGRNGRKTFYTLLDRKFEPNVTVGVPRRGPSGGLVIYDEIWKGTVDIIENTLILQNGRLLDYDDLDNKCSYAGKPKVKFDCRQQSVFEVTYYSGPVEEVTVNRTKILRFSKRNKSYSFMLVKDYQRCNRVIWATNVSSVLAFENDNSDDCYEDVRLSKFAVNEKINFEFLT
ncbi:unnamed protein product [Phyllotreta striolata]|uniref:Uncharacterized protein n=1 Tax=Phyllotreta striolata TaxID=444603 RepID=A0A9N9XK93_PHYSR|nr:unnamed protein product [Phyllotreta striolata]